VKIYIVVDMEGISGVIGGKETDPSDKNYPAFRKIMTNEVNTVVKTAFEAGTERVLINDYHAFGQNIIIEELHRDAELIRGDANPVFGYGLSGLNESFNGLIHLGVHARKGERFGIINHTLSGAAVADLKVNGTSIGEFELIAAAAGDMNVPVILVSGDVMVTERAKELLPGIETVPTKFGFNDVSARCLTPEKVASELVIKTREALFNLSKFKPLKYSGNNTIELRYVKQGMADLGGLLPGVERIDPYTVRWQASSGIDIYRKVLTLVAVSSWIPMI
jgi:D-amino peptidase